MLDPPAPVAIETLGNFADGIQRFGIGGCPDGMDRGLEAALRRTNAKFTRRFNAIEDALEAEGRTPADSTLEEMYALWTRIKQAEKPRAAATSATQTPFSC